MEGRGYDRIEFLTSDLDQDRYTYADDEAGDEQVFCYRVTAVFARLNANQNPVNSVESKPSEEVCILSNRNRPFMTMNDVISTDESSGEINIAWLMPNAEEYDIIENPGPYTVEVLQTEPAITNPILSTSYNDFDDIPVLDTLMVSNLNTENTQYHYQVDLINGNSDRSSADSASSIFLSTVATDMEAQLSWSSSVPWENISYMIYRSIDGGIFELIDETVNTTYIDGDLENAVEYCYFIRSTGTYSVEPFPDPIINNSQEACVTPIDNEAPCPLPLEAIGICQQLEEGAVLDAVFNQLMWSNNLIDCPENADIGSYNIYFGSGPDADFDLIDEVDTPLLNYEDPRSNIVGGCYYITAVDSVGNQSLPSDTLCLSRCSIFELPNTFTPNADGANDLFIPRSNLFVDEVDFRVFNKWGNLIYRTSDPQLNWDGKNMNNSDVDDGTYYYTCEIFQGNDLGLNESVEVLSGYIEVIR
jgi:gliding motility-associated-like protein